MMRAVFAVPGDISQTTGGYIYDRTVLRTLNDLGCAVAPLELPESYPYPSCEDQKNAIACLQSVPSNCAIIVDGLALGAMNPGDIARLTSPVVAMVHHPLGFEPGLDEDRAKYLIENETEVLRHVAWTIVPSAHVQSILEGHLGVDPRRICVAHPGVEKVQVHREPVHPPLILSVGILAKRKGHDVLLQALKLIEDLNWQVVVVGKPHEEGVYAGLVQQADDLGLSDRVRFVGEQTSAELKDLYRTASIFALATRFEGYGMVFNEAMHHGLPIVTCAVGAVPETVGDAALMVAPNSPKPFAQSLRTVLEVPGTAYACAEKARLRAEALPEWRTTARHFLDVIERVTR